MSSRSSTRWVSEMHVLCSLPMRADALAMSDCCRESAVGAVYDGSAYMYRCAKHLDIVTNFGGRTKTHRVTGPFVAELPADDEPPGANDSDTQ
jgi:hypothetical protein